MFYFSEINGQKVLKSDLLEDVNAFFTTRGDTSSLMSSFSCRIISPIQTHSDNIELVDNRNEYPNTDSLILSQTDTLIYLRFADCTPLIFYDKKHNVASIAHAGWRGTVARIGVLTLRAMYAAYGTRPEDVLLIL